MKAAIKIEYDKERFAEVEALIHLLNLVSDKSDVVYKNLRSVDGGVLWQQEEVEKLRDEFFDKDTL